MRKVLVLGLSFAIVQAVCSQATERGAKGKQAQLGAAVQAHRTANPNNATAAASPSHTLLVANPNSKTVSPATGSHITVKNNATVSPANTQKKGLKEVTVHVPIQKTPSQVATGVMPAQSGHVTLGSNSTGK